ncbi:glycosyltransferase family 2 protein [Tsukamurella sp. 8F]|uniref:glycosyltransferase family 2 protein n=1 Tax=unclassified Tsukamurella TaxID=2633480 RepID=UPI0023B9082E|nr:MULTISPECIES: glycosyltransferase family 2 protein [unclassified Tsukamurella]MDF0529025.1 glycosyltransferase family 2 protein [Tsukamurella sp. 8J]MDF0587398.1 glycosyltransferase family 2 protein [Tsukamurella sp. 8F]
MAEDGAEHRRERVAVVTVTYSPGEHLDDFLASIPAATITAPRVLMADNGSVDGAPEAAAERYPFARLLRTGANLGYGGAVNFAAAQVPVDVEFLLVANPDVRFAPGAIDELLAAADRLPGAGAFGPLIRDPDGTVYPSAREVPQLVSGAGHAVLGKVWPANPWTRTYQQAEAAIAERDAGWLSGSCLLVRRAAFDALGGFDDRYFMYMEDVDLGDRLTRAGWRNVYVPSAEIVHAKGHAAGRVPEVTLRAHHVSAYRFFADRNPGPARLPLRVALKAGLGARSRIAVTMAKRARAGAVRER